MTIFVRKLQGILAQSVRLFYDRIEAETGQNSGQKRREEAEAKTFGCAFMSKFSAYLKNLLEKNGESISFVARSIGAERTSIHKALADERILPYKVVAALARHFRLSLDERQEFFRLYDILLQGEENYRNRQAICTLLNHLSSLRFQMPVPPSEACPTGEDLIKGEYAVRSAIRSVLIYEATHTPEAEFQCFLPPKLNLTTELMQLWLNGYAFSVQQLLSFQSTNGGDSVQNLALLQQILPLCLASKGRYTPWYFCERPKSRGLHPLGHYLITPHYLIQFDEYLSVAQIQQNRELVEYFRNSFLNLLQHCEPLTHCSTNIMEVLQEYIHHSSPDSLQVLMSQPCPGRYITREIIAKYLRSNDMPYQQMFELVDHRFAMLRQVEKHYCTVFTQEGLLDLLKTGVLEDLPPEYVPPLKQEDIQGMLRQLREEIAQGRVLGLITRPLYLQLPRYLSIYADERTGLHFYTTNDFVYGAYCCNIHITEESICRAFLDFFQSLPGSPMVYSREDTLAILDRQLAPGSENP